MSAAQWLSDWRILALLLAGWIAYLLGSIREQIAGTREELDSIRELLQRLADRIDPQDSDDWPPT